MTESRQSECQEWTGSPRRGGYGPHRDVYRREKGPIPKGYHVHHTCRNRACVNPEHLELLPAREHFILTFLEERGRTIQDVFDIRRMAREGISAPELAHRYGLGRRTIDGILNGEVWREETGGARVEPERVCGYCGGPIVGRNRHALYCSASHRSQAHAKRQIPTL
jgi:hypothetical protein